MKKLRLFSGLAMTALAATAFAQTEANPAVIQPGENSYDGSAYYTYWTYTPQQDELVNLMGVAASSVTVKVEDGGEKSVAYYAQSSTWSSNPVQTVFQVQAGSTYVMEVYKSYSYGSTQSYTFDAEITPYPYNDGLDCSDPIVADRTDIFIPTTGRSGGYASPATYYPVFVEYTADIDGVLDISMVPAPDKLSWAEVGESTCDVAYTSVSDIAAKNTFPIEKGKSYIFKFELVGAILAQFQSRVPVLGATCEDAFTANMGENEIPAEAGTYWYKVNIDNAGYLTITSDAEGSISLDTRCNPSYPDPRKCDAIALRLKVDAESSRVFSITKGETAAPVAFNIAVEGAQAYDNNNGGLVIETGKDYTTPAFGGTYYYEVNAPAEGAYFLNVEVDSEAAGLKCNIREYNDQWGSYSSIAEGSNSVSAEMKKGGKYQIQLYTPNNVRGVTFKAFLKEVEKGQTRNNPIVAELGVNNIAAQTSTYYSFTPAKSAWLVVSTPADVSLPKLTLATDKYNSPTSYSTDPTGDYDQAYRWMVTAGTEYIMEFGLTEEASTFEISEVDYAAGEAISSAITIGEDGVVNLPEDAGIYWYKYNVTSDGFAYISTTLSYKVDGLYTNVVIYPNDETGSNGYSLPSSWTNDGYVLGEKKLAVATGDVLYIKVDKAAEAGTVSIVVSEARPGETPNNPIVVEFTDNAASVDVPKISYSSDPMYYKMHLTPGIFSMTTSSYITSYLYKGLENVINNNSMASSTSFNTADGYMNGFKSVSIDEEGDYYLKVSSCSDAGVFNMVIRGPLPGETADNPIVIVLDTNPGTFDFEEIAYGTVCWYSIKLQPGDLAIKPAKYLSGYLYSSEDLATSIASFGYDEDYNSVLNATITEAGTYFIKVTTNYYNQSVEFSGSAVDLNTGVAALGNGAFAVKAFRGAIAVSGNGEVAVTDLQGRKVASANVDGTATISLGAGMYIVSDGKKAVKVVVK